MNIKKVVSFSLTTFLMFLYLVSLVHASSFSNATVSSVHVSLTPNTLQTFQVTVALNGFISEVKATIAHVEISGWGSAWVTLNSTLPLNLTTVGGITQGILLFRVFVPSNTAEGNYSAELLITVTSGAASSTTNAYAYLDVVSASANFLPTDIICGLIAVAFLILVYGFLRKRH